MSGIKESENVLYVLPVSALYQSAAANLDAVAWHSS